MGQARGTAQAHRRGGLAEGTEARKELLQVGGRQGGHRASVGSLRPTRLLQGSRARPSRAEGGRHRGGASEVRWRVSRASTSTTVTFGHAGSSWLTATFGHG